MLRLDLNFTPTSEIEPSCGSFLSDTLREYQAMIRATEHAKIEDGEIVCHCLKVTGIDLREALLIHDPQTVRDITRCTGAGGGCTACHARLTVILQQTSYFPSPICSVK